MQKTKQKRISKIIEWLDPLQKFAHCKSQEVQKVINTNYPQK